MCDNVVWRDPYSLIGVPDCFMTSQQIKIWRYSDCSMMRMLSGGMKVLETTLNNRCMPEDEKNSRNVQ